MWNYFDLRSGLDTRQYVKACALLMFSGIAFVVFWIFSLGSQNFAWALMAWMVVFAFAHLFIYSKRLKFRAISRYWLLLLPVIFYFTRDLMYWAWTSTSLDEYASQMLTSVVLEHGNKELDLIYRLKFVPAIIVGTLPFFIEVFLYNLLINYWPGFKNVNRPSVA